MRRSSARTHREALGAAGLPGVEELLQPVPLAQLRQCNVTDTKSVGATELDGDPGAVKTIEEQKAFNTFQLNTRG